jgi:hypothetical protein
MGIYAYVDETEFLYHKLDDNSFIGNGILVTETPIGKLIIDEALYNLKIDPDKNDRDIKTLQSGYFHASGDTKNAHSHLCNSINKHIKGVFRYSYFEQDKMKKLSKEQSVEALFLRTFKLNLLEFFSYNHKKIHLEVESREDLNTQKIKLLFNDLFDSLDKNAYDLASFITYYPELNVSLHDKTNPGIQVVDFILWAFNRSQKNDPNNIWKDRLKFKFSSNHREQDGPRSSGEYHLNIMPKFDGRLSYPPFKVEISNTTEGFYSSYLLIECCVKFLGTIDIPISLVHLKYRLDIFLKEVTNIDSKFEVITLQELARLFIRFFDSLPIYEALGNDQINEWKSILSAKKLAGLLLRTDLLHSNRSLGALVRWRNQPDVKLYISKLEFTSFIDIINHIWQ